MCVTFGSKPLRSVTISGGMSPSRYLHVSVHVCVFPQFDPSCEFYPTELQRIGPVIHLLHGPYAIVIALVQCWFFIRHLLPKSPGSFSFIRLSLERQYRASHGHAYGPSRQNFIPEWASDKWAELRPMRGFGKEWFRLSGSVLFTQVSIYPAAEKNELLTPVMQRKQHGNVLGILKMEALVCFWAWNSKLKQL